MRTKPKNPTAKWKYGFLTEIRQKKSRAAFSNIRANNRPLNLYWDTLITAPPLFRNLLQLNRMILV